MNGNSVYCVIIIPTAFKALDGVPSRYVYNHLLEISANVFAEDNVLISWHIFSTRTGRLNHDVN
jgi:hypothetical protein